MLCRVIEAYGLGIEALRVVGATYSGAHQLVLRVGHVPNRLEKIGVAGNTTAVLGGQARSPARHTG